ncbi:hypothetical protein TCAL_04926 [Tigriopus californicus]|uniref:protein-histidine N-methyltransferase n=1 Tax=Tigriopus californicus TaxID=6832 RepID=A0A553NBJ0_TIGCA|nr:histidine protein methyltransferase 1 homolog [Tigriopus californicus]TRY62816.1 hypothetical protein TCAL_04926 [Tigriopus californicus]|eukprot:TCALIF_04926-PA protein Name:"Similar to DDB_G0270580 Histidine protein methyltransferase 1 homolog (Dictyostelium discoideum)" AED:0.41 eAED:0.41 QI:0/-1/0/1/-1/1/1/0/277
MFKFNFNQSDQDLPQVLKKTEPTTKIDWLESKVHSIPKESESRDFPSLNIPISKDLTLKVIQSHEISAQLIESNDNLTSVLGESDLQPGVYEGGLKIWECSEDLAKYLERDLPADLSSFRVLELGCGAALPGLVCLRRGAHVDFQDYNPEVLDHVTIPNYLLNRDKSRDINSTFLSGDWDAVRASLTKDSCTYDLILASETIYNPDNYAKLIRTFRDLLSKDSKSSVLLAAKTHYFGVGGGTRQFEEELTRTGDWDIQNVSKTHDGVQREIIRISRK